MGTRILRCLFRCPDYLPNGIGIRPTFPKHFHVVPTYSKLNQTSGRDSLGSRLIPYTMMDALARLQTQQFCCCPSQTLSQQYHHIRQKQTSNQPLTELAEILATALEAFNTPTMCEGYTARYYCRHCVRFWTSQHINQYCRRRCGRLSGGEMYLGERRCARCSGG